MSTICLQYLFLNNAYIKLSIITTSSFTWVVCCKGVGNKCKTIVCDSAYFISFTNVRDLSQKYKFSILNHTKLLLLLYM